MALRLVAAVVGGLSGSDRGIAAIHTDALKAVDKCLKDRSASHPIKIAAAAVIKAVAEAGGAGLWANAGAAFDDTARVCVMGLADPSLTVREAFAAALGEVAALGETAGASNVSSAKEAVRHLTLTCLQASMSKASREMHVIGSTLMHCLCLTAWLAMPNSPPESTTSICDVG